MSKNNENQVYVTVETWYLQKHQSAAISSLLIAIGAIQSTPRASLLLPQLNPEFDISLLTATQRCQY